MIFRFKQGDTYFVTCSVTDDEGTPINLSGFTIRSQIRQPTGELIAELDVDITDAAQGDFVMSDDDTQEWPVGCQFQDIEYTDSGETVVSTQTFKIDIQQDITQ